MKTSSEIFTEAASRIVMWGERRYPQEAPLEPSNQTCCCDAILLVSINNDKDCEAFGMFEVYFKPRKQSLYWYADPRETDEDQEARKLALLFMAEIAADPDQKRYDK